MQCAGFPLPSAGFAETSCQSRGARAAPRLGRLGGRQAAALCPRSTAPGPRVPPPAPPAARRPPAPPALLCNGDAVPPGLPLHLPRPALRRPGRPTRDLGPARPAPATARSPGPRPASVAPAPSPKATDSQPGHPGFRVDLWSAYSVLRPLWSREGWHCWGGTLGSRVTPVPQR